MQLVSWTGFNSIETLLSPVRLLPIWFILSPHLSVIYSPLTTSHCVDNLLYWMPSRKPERPLSICGRVFQHDSLHKEPLRSASRLGRLIIIRLNSIARSYWKLAYNLILLSGPSCKQSEWSLCIYTRRVTYFKIHKVLYQTCPANTSTLDALPHMSCKPKQILFETIEHCSKSHVREGFDGTKQGLFSNI